jgi:hypothetical protein
MDMDMDMDMDTLVRLVHCGDIQRREQEGNQHVADVGIDGHDALQADRTAVEHNGVLPVETWLHTDTLSHRR